MYCPISLAASVRDANEVRQANSDLMVFEIDVAGNYRVRVGSSFDPRALRRVLDVLKRR